MPIFTLVLLVVGMVSSVWFSRRYPNPSRVQTAAVVASLVGSILVIAQPRNHDSAWFYIGAVIATVAITFLLTQARRRLA